MPAALSPSVLDEARDPLFRLIVRNWILRGNQRLDGLVCVKAWAQDTSQRGHWPRLLLPWLDRAEQVQESADYVWLRFADPVVIECELLGCLLPLRRQGGVLSSAEIDVPAASIATTLNETMILHVHGERCAVPLSSFDRVDIGGLWDMSAATVLDTIPLPLLDVGNHAPKTLKTRTDVPFDPADAQAGFGDLRQRVENTKAPGILRRLGDGWHNNVHLLKWPIAVALMIVIGAAIYTVITELPDAAPTDIKAPPHTEPTYTPPFGALIWIVVFATLAVWKRRGANTPVRSPGTGTGTGTGSAPTRPGWLRRVINWMMSARSRGQATSTASRPSGPASPKERSWWGRAAAWLVWRTPLRQGLLRQYERRLRELERLFRAGRIEEALKRAIALAGEQDRQGETKTAYGDMPLSGPSIRERLELDLSSSRSKSSPLLTDDGYKHFQELYREQAKRFLEAGDLQRAIFIYAELLGDTRGAIDLLIKAGQLETAARLAQARRLPPGFFIPLWFRAGNKQRALDLAARHEAFAELWKELKPEDPFRAVVGLEWARRLAASGHYVRALTISDEVLEWARRLEVHGDDDRVRAIRDKLGNDVTTLRHEWMRRALQGPQQGELIARALIALPWSNEDNEGPYAAFQQLLEAGPDLADERVKLAEALANPTFEKQGRVDQFKARLSLLAHHLAKRLAVDEAEFGHDSDRAGAALRLSEHGRQFALRVDLRRLAKVPKPHLASAHTSLELAPSPFLAAIIDAVVLPGRQVLIAYRSGLVKLVSFSGREIWRDQVNGLHGLVPVGVGHTILLVRDDLGERHLSVLETAPLRHRELGEFPVTFYHPWASAENWLVFSGRDALCLDVASLLAGTTANSDGEFVKHWAIPMSEPGRPLLFVEDLPRVHFVYERYDGLVEWWWLEKSSLSITCSYWTNPLRESEAGDAVVSVNHIVWESTSSMSPIHRTGATRDQELKMIAEVPLGQAPLVSMQPAASREAVCWRASVREHGVNWFAKHLLSKEPVQFQVSFLGAEWVHAHPHLHEPFTTVFDNLGRLLVINVKEGTVLMKTV